MTTISDASPIPIPTSQPKLSGSYAALPNAIKIAVFISAATLLFIVLSLLLSLCVYYHKRFRRPRESPDIRLSNFTPRPSSTATGNTLPLYAPRDLTIGIPHHSTYFQRPPSYATEHSGDVSGPSATRGGVSMVLGSTCELDAPPICEKLMRY
ncbi:uncharacterized protein MELLADRAFT_109612 [Melampsora larici-populina 98AG31]|uniref:Uncharacterized protein n=1 Tax=Melampsora larici-populina (strain 98AG31 / pathotype 3-4-7) TaxID=747676 RepID=F4RX16_MELLP|nr:uncharacterized protein MELLADRAFT_109612 [Melampsora larici-populina 98AG31]EGG03116.1 hypothetical protein MELLADRAFT_109612 [Melampsora larici-populina 98AG31]